MTFLISTRRMVSVVARSLLLAPVAARAQEPRRLIRSDSIPLELATALIANGGLGAEPQILVGSMPGWVTDRVYVPANARVLGSAFIGTAVVAVLSVPDAPEAVIADFKREQLKRGWKAPPPQPSYGGGFRPAPSSDFAQPATRLTVCSDQQMLIASSGRHLGASTQVVVRIAAAATYSTCNPAPASVGMTRTIMPTLFNPPSTNDPRMNFDCSVLVGPSSGTGSNLRTTMSPDALLDHYAKQLQDSGWTLSGGRASIVGRTWTRNDSTGAPIDVMLTVAASARDSTCRELNLQVRSIRKP